MPLLNFKIREKMNFDYSNIIVFGPVLELNYIYKFFGANIKDFFFCLKNKSVDFSKSLLFFYNNKKNSILNKIINYLKIPKFNVSLNNNFGLLSNELNFNKLNSTCLFNKFFFLNFENNSNHDFSFLKFNDTVSVNLCQNIFNSKSYNLLIPRKFNFEQNSLFINIFGEFNDFTFMLYKIDLKTLKNDWNILENFLNFLSNTNNKIKLSIIRKKFIPLNLKLSVYKLSIFCFCNFNIEVKTISNNKNFFFFKNNFYYTDIFSKNNVLFNYLKHLKNKNLFNIFLNINSVHWVF